MIAVQDFKDLLARYDAVMARKLPVVTHTTMKGKELRGVVRTDLTKDQAKGIDPYTFRKDGGWFIREQHLTQESKSAAVPDVAPIVGGSAIPDSENAPKAPFDKLQRSFPIKGGKIDIQYSAKESKKMLAAVLKQAFPDTKFSIKSTYAQYGQGYAVSWTDGASVGMVNRILQHFIGYQDGHLDQTGDFRHVGDDLVVRNADNQIVSYDIYALKSERKTSKEFAEKLLQSLAQGRYLADSKGDLTIDAAGDVYEVVEDGRVNHYVIRADWRGGFSVLEHDGSGMGRHRKSDLINGYSERKYNSFSKPPKAKRGFNDVSATGDNVESDWGRLPDGQSDYRPNDAAGSGTSGRNTDGTTEPVDARGLLGNIGVSVSDDDAASVGDRSDQPVLGGRGQSNSAPSGRSGSGQSGSTGLPTTARRSGKVVSNAAQIAAVDDSKQAIQAAASGAPTEWGDKDSIDKALPYLMAEQRNDVLKAEQRLIGDNANGILFTNGTGTGKTFTGLGIAKRFANDGKSNILIVSMNDKIVRDFAKSGKALGLDIHQLTGIDDNGGASIVATTYANMAQNNTLAQRDWDLIIVDESHNLMQSADGKNTGALDKLQALTGHHSGFYDWVKMRYPEKVPPTGAPNEQWREYEDFIKPLRQKWQSDWESQSTGRAKVVFLSATPFAYVKTVDWAEGYLFDYTPPSERYLEKAPRGYNQGDDRSKFFMRNFGYRMRTNRLSQPDGKADMGYLERKFADSLKKTGALSGRDLSVPFDYDRKFIIVESRIGELIDEGMRYLWDSKDAAGKSLYSDVYRLIQKRFDYMTRRTMLEAIKADAAIDLIKKHLKLGRKVVVFHDYNTGGTSNPFRSVSGNALEARQYEQFAENRPDLANLDLSLPSPSVSIKRAFPKALMFNGEISKGQRAKNADLFNTDGSGHDVLIVQSDAGSTGISLHDTTGKHQRVIINLGVPSKPAKLRQTEGRIYRVGQASNAIQRYLTTGTDWERSTFAETVAGRAETVDNLAQGSAAITSIKNALVAAYENAEYSEPSELDGIGGKAYDAENARIAALSPFDRAKSDYYVKQKITAKRGNREGVEWYATPEPVGLKMMELSGAHTGDQVLEPSAGDGAIGRYAPEDASITMIEPSEALASRAKMSNSSANVIVSDFESHETVNKYDSIVMNPPFGQGGSMAIKHIEKALQHLRDGGRLVALIPVGAMDAKVDALLNRWTVAGSATYSMIASILLPESTFQNAGTKVRTRIIVLQRKAEDVELPKYVSRDYSNAEDIDELFTRIEHLELPPRPLRKDEQWASYSLNYYPEKGQYFIDGDGVNDPIIKKVLDTEGRLVDDGRYMFNYDRSSYILSAIGKAIAAANAPLDLSQYSTLRDKIAAAQRHQAAKA